MTLRGTIVPQRSAKKKGGEGMPKVRITYIMSKYGEDAETCIDLHVTEAVAESLDKYQGDSPYVSYAGRRRRRRAAARSHGHRGR